MRENVYDKWGLEKSDKNRKFIYFPSLSSGNSKCWLMDDDYLNADISSRFYKKGTPDKWYFPYFLISAGHNLGNTDMAVKLGLEDTLTIGDSGGFQIASGAKKFSEKQRDMIFEWLENNSDLAMNLDIPPKMKLEGRFNECLTISVDNFKHFEKNQTGKTKFLTVLQGGNEEEYKVWYNAVKDFQFQGWAWSNTHLLHRLMFLFAHFIENKEFEKPNFKVLHILGVSTLTDFVIMSMLQQAMNERYDGKIQLCTDSSSPNRATIFGTYFFDINWKSTSLLSLYFGKGNTPYKLDAPLPCRMDCPACKGQTFESIHKFEEEAYMRMTNHNLYLFLEAKRTIEKILDGHDELLKESLSRDFVEVRESIRDIFTSSTPVKTYEKYKPLYIKIKGNDNSTIDKTKLDSFFEM